MRRLTQRSLRKLRSEPPNDESTIRQLLNRRELAATRHRAAVSRALGLSDTEMLAVAHLAQHGEMIPAALGASLSISSGAVTALVQRMEAAGGVVRAPHPTDGRSVLVRLSPALVARAQAAYLPLVRELDRITSELSEQDQLVIRRFLERAVTATEQNAKRVRERQTRRTSSGEAAPAPGLWG